MKHFLLGFSHGQYEDEGVTVGGTDLSEITRNVLYHFGIFENIIFDQLCHYQLSF
jgi:hypothetical protein